jgi:hypothetical protein
MDKNKFLFVCFVLVVLLTAVFVTQGCDAEYTQDNYVSEVNK